MGVAMKKLISRILVAVSLVAISPYCSGITFPDWVIPMRTINASFTGDEFYAGKVGDSYMTSASFWNALTGSSVDLDGKISPNVLSSLLSATTLPDYSSPATGVGWTTFHVLNGSPSPLDQYLLGDPEVSMIMFGTSDIGLNNPTAFENNLNQIVSDILGANSIPVLNTLPPQVGRLTEVQQYNTIIRNVAGSWNIPLSDLYDEVMLRQPVNWDSTLIAGDGIHFSGCTYTAVFTDSNLDTCGYALMNYVNLRTYSEIYNYVLTAPVPVPPAFLLFGSGLMGLIGIARRKKLV